MRSARIGLRLVAVASLAVFAFACADGPTNAPEVDGPAFAKAAAAGNSYLVLGNGNKLPNKLASAVARYGGTITREIPQIGIAVVTSDDPAFAERASGIAGVQSVVFDYTVELFMPELVEEGIPTSAYGNPPNSGDDDFLFDLQWGHDAVDAPEAWNAGARGAGVRVAILDSGIDAEHPDLAPNLNAALSASFIDGEDWNVRPGTFFNHGSHVAGTVAAADNGFGVIGVAPEAEIVAVKVLSEYSGSGPFSRVIAGIVYAADINADIINMSLSGMYPRSLYGSDGAALAVAVGRATTYAYQQGTAIFAAAANDGIDRDHDADLLVLPADAPHVIAISATAPEGWGADATTDLDVPASYTNYGQSRISFAAPGGDWSYAYTPGGFDACTVAGLTRPCYVFDYVMSTGSQGWWWATGTSMATPHAVGVAALIIGENGGDMHPSQLEAALRKAADDLGKPGNDDWYGAGRVNAYNAVK